MPRRTCEERIEEAVEEALRQEREELSRYVRSIEFTADSFTFDAVNSVIEEIAEMIERRSR